MSSSPRTAHLLLRAGVALAFLYPPIKAISDPQSWLGYFPHFLRALPIDQLLLLHSFGLIEVIIALWILSGWQIRLPAAVATVMLVAIVFFNFADIEILFRDISIALMALALVFWPRAEA